MSAPRTATTLQTISLAALMALMHPDKKVTITFGGADAIQGLVSNYDPTQFQIIKTHRNPNEWSHLVGPDTWVFSTSPIEMTNTVQPQFIQSMDDVNRFSFTVASQYAQLFNVSDTISGEMLAYLRYWDILRVCCGTQMSKDWRAVLLKKEDYTPTHAFDSLNYPGCEIYDLDRVEENVLKTKAAQLLGEVMGIAGKNDLTGKYCTWFNRQVTCQKLQFNEKPVEPYC